MHTSRTTAASPPARSRASTSRCNVDGDARPERVALFGRDIVVLGPGFKSGTGYACISLTQFADDKDVTSVTAATSPATAPPTSSSAAFATSRRPPASNVDIDGALRLPGEERHDRPRLRASRRAASRRASACRASCSSSPPKSGKGFDVDVRPGVAARLDRQDLPVAAGQAGRLDRAAACCRGEASRRSATRGTARSSRRPDERAARRRSVTQ